MHVNSKRFSCFVYIVKYFTHFIKAVQVDPSPVHPHSNCFIIGFYFIFTMACMESHCHRKPSDRPTD